jgi:anti-sigma factor RsiW
MSHLGARLSALVDGELGHDERDRVLAHLAHCAGCRDEASALRRLKQRIHDLDDEAAGAELARRLVALAEPGEPVPPRGRPFPGAARPRPEARMYPDSPAFFGRPPHAGARARHRRAPYLVAGVFSVLVAGVGSASFLVGGGQPAPGPHVTPPAGMFTVEHSVTTGEVPFAAPTASYIPTGVGPSQLP